MLAAADQQLLCGAGRVRGPVFFRDAVTAALLAQVFTEQLAGAGIEYDARIARPTAP